MSADVRVALRVAGRLEQGAREALAQAGVDDVPAFSVPGTFELPTIAQYTTVSGRFVGVVCLGAVIRGDTDHYDYVCSAAADGILRVALDTGAPRSGLGGLQHVHNSSRDLYRWQNDVCGQPPTPGERVLRRQAWGIRVDVTARPARGNPAKR